MASDSGNAGQWFVRVKDGQRGPFSGAQIRSFAAAGKITPATPLRRGDRSHWNTAGSIQGLFKTALTAPDEANLPRSDVSPTGGVQQAVHNAAAAVTVATSPGIASLAVLACSLIGSGLIASAIVTALTGGG